MASKTVSIQFDEETLRLVDATATHYRWKRSQAVAEYVSFYHRLQEQLKRFEVAYDTVSGDPILIYWETGYDGRQEPFPLDSEAETFLRNLVQDLKRGLLGGFSDINPHFNIDDDEEDEG